MKKSLSLFVLLFVSLLFATVTANAVTVNKIKKNIIVQPTESNAKAYIIAGLYTVPDANTAKIKAVRNIVTFLKKHGYYNVSKAFFKTTKQERIGLIKKTGFPIIIGIPEKRFKFIYKTGFVNKNVLIANEGVNIKPKAISLIHLLMKNGYNVGIATTSPKGNKFWHLRNVSFPFITIIP